MLQGEQLERVAVAHADPEAQAAAYEFLKRFPITPDAAHGPGLVIATGRAELIPEVTEEHLQRASGGDPENLEALRTIGMTSLICAPLIARGRVLGTITMLSDSPSASTGLLTSSLRRSWRGALRLRSTTRCCSARSSAGPTRPGCSSTLATASSCSIATASSASGTAPPSRSHGSRPTRSWAGRRWRRSRAGPRSRQRARAAKPTTGSSAETLPLELPERELWLSIAAVEFNEGTVYAFRDLTADRVLEELRSDFVSTVSHELRTPLAAIYGAALTLQREDLQLDETQSSNCSP